MPGTGLLLALVLTTMCACPSAAGAARVYRTIQVTKPFPSAQPLFVSAAPPAGVRSPVVLSARSGINALQEWWFAQACYPGCSGDITGGAGLPDVPAPYEVGFKLVNRQSGLCMTIDGPRNPGTPVILWPCRTEARSQVIKPGLSPDLYPRQDIVPPGPAMLSELRDVDSPARAAPNATTMRCLEVTGLQHVPGTRITMAGCHGGWSQNFILNRAVRDNRRPLRQWTGWK